MQNLGDRMKRYEFVARRYLTTKVPVIIRVDGRAFHTFTRKMEKPFDLTFANAMIEASKIVAKNMSGFKLGYIASDEASFLLTDFEDTKTQGWFDYCANKIETISASLMSVGFNRSYPIPLTKVIVFDSRSFNVPKEDVPNYFVWRQKDWIRNSISMIGRAHFSHKQLMNKRTVEIEKMVIEKTGQKPYHTYEKMSLFGTYLLADGSETYLENVTYADVQNLIETKEKENV